MAPCADRCMVNKPAISAIGQSQVGRRLGRTGMQLTVEAVKAALEDAELSIADIDGIASWPGRASLPGFSPVGVDEAIDTLGLEVNWFCGGSEGPGQLASIINAYAAVKCGFGASRPLFPHPDRGVFSGGAGTVCAT